MINNKRAYEIPAATVRLYRKASQAVASPKHSQMQTPSNRSADQAPSEFLHIIATLHPFYDTYKGTTHDSSQLCCNECQSLCGSHCKRLSYFPKQVPLENQLYFQCQQKNSHVKSHLLSLRQIFDIHKFSQLPSKCMISAK